MTRIAEIVRAWPKAELHLHLEGSMRPATVVELARRHGVSVTPEEVAARYSYPDFDGFIQSYIWVTSFLRRPEDYAFIAHRLFEELAGQNVTYAEITLSVGVMLWREQDASAIFGALRAAGEEAARGGLRAQWVFDVVRQFGPEKAMDVARLAVRHTDEGVVAFGMGGDELAVPAGHFQEAYDYTRNHGLHSLVHAGEIGEPDEVRRAVELLGAERVGHGIAAFLDPAVMAMLAERRIPLEVCPTSNLRTGALTRLWRSRSLPRSSASLPSLREHPVAQLFHAGVPVTLSTDDPAMFETTLAGEYEAAAQAGLTVHELASIAEEGMEAAFLAAPERDRLLARLREMLRAQGLVY
jgi:adenosine deaminase